MSTFSTNQLKKLVGKLDRARVHSREIDGRQIDYIEGWFAIAEANVIFGYGGWDREMAYFERVFERTRDNKTSCAYIARVRIRVRAGTDEIIREGTGFGHARAEFANEAHERALKAAETDATKRALATFGNRFGLGLYDKDPVGITRDREIAEMPSKGTDRNAPLSEPINRFQLKTEDGTLLAENLSAEGFCSGLRQLAESTYVASQIEALRTHNAEAIAALRQVVPSLVNLKGRHYVDILEDLLAQRACVLEGTSSGCDDVKKNVPVETNKKSRISTGPVIDKSALAWPETRRVRNKAHLARVAAEPCLICSETPTHAHHVTFAQPRGLSIKVSDEFTVPLCAMHHNGLHLSGHEEAWWRKCGIDPLAAARLLWEQTLASADLQRGETTPPSGGAIK